MQQTPNKIEIVGAVTVSQKTIMADSDKARWQAVPQNRLINSTALMVAVFKILFLRSLYPKLTLPSSGAVIPYTPMRNKSIHLFH